MVAVAGLDAWVNAFQHEALIYEGLDGFLAGTVPFVTEGLERGEPMLVAVPGSRLDALRDVFRSDLDRVELVDMQEVGRNPAHLIPAWRDFLAAADAGQPVRGIGEPIWAGRSSSELAECQRHESLLNVAFAESGWRLLCPYDRQALPGDVIEEAERSHPWVSALGVRSESQRCRALDEMAAPFSAPLPPPPSGARSLDFEFGSMSEVRRFVRAVARDRGVHEARARDLVLAVNEIASNSVLHGGGAGTVRVWHEGDRLVCEVTDGGRIDAPLVGRERPAPDCHNGRGVWMANQLCDLVQIRTFADGNAVRLHVCLS